MTRTLRLGLTAALGLLAVASAAPTPAHTSNGTCADSASVRNLKASVVGVSVISGNRPETAVGFVFGTERVLTVAHAVLGATNVRIVPPGAGTATSATVVTVDRRRDLAILDVPGLHATALRPTNVAPIAASCATMLTIRAGRVVTVEAAVRRSVQVTIDAPSPARRSALELAVPVRRGNSGAPIIDTDGQVEEVMFAASSSGSPTGWAVDASELNGFLDASLVAG